MHTTEEAKQLLQELEQAKLERPWMYGYQSVRIPGIREFHKSKARIRLLSANNRGGKSTRGAWELVCFATGYHPIRKEHYPLPNITWAVALDNKNYGHIVKSRLQEWLPAGTEFKEQKQMFILPPPWNSRIYLKSAEPGETKFAAEGLLAAWFDEGRETVEGPFMETLSRLKPGWPLRVFLTMTPEDGMGGWTWRKFYDQDSKERFKGAEIFYFTMEECLVENGGHITREEFENFKADQPEWKWKAKVYGRPGVMASDPYFRPDHIDKLEARADTPIPGRIEADAAGIVRHVPDDRGDVYILRPPVPGRRYLMPIDVAGGVGRDYTVAAVLDPVDKAEVAYFKSNRRDVEHATTVSIMPLGRYYNRAIAIPETNGEHGTGLLTILRERKYGKIYRRRMWKSLVRRYVEEYGWRTSETGSRNLIYDEWAHALRENEWAISKDALKEARMVSEKEGRPDHPDGTHDDHFFAVGIGIAALHMRPEIARTYTPPQVARWTYEDEMTLAD